jgi:hypothetical protein
VTESGEIKNYRVTALSEGSEFEEAAHVATAVNALDGACYATPAEASKWEVKQVSRMKTETGPTRLCMSGSPKGKKQKATAKETEEGPYA